MTRLEFDIPAGSVGDCYDRYLVRIEEMRQSVRILRQCLDKIPGGADNTAKEPVNIAGRQNRSALQIQSADQHGGIDPSIHARHRRASTRRRAKFISAAENPKGELGFYINSKGGGTPYRLKIRTPVVCQPEHPVPLDARPHDQRHGGDFRLARFRHGGV